MCVCMCVCVSVVSACGVGIDLPNWSEKPCACVCVVSACGAGIATLPAELERKALLDAEQQLLSARQLRVEVRRSLRHDLKTQHETEQGCLSAWRPRGNAEESVTTTKKTTATATTKTAGRFLKPL